MACRPSQFFLSVVIIASLNVNDTDDDKQDTGYIGIALALDFENVNTEYIESIQFNGRRGLRSNVILVDLDEDDISGSV